jgi:hypothetical protein
VSSKSTISVVVTCLGCCFFLIRSKESKEATSSHFKRLTVKRVDRLPKKPIFIIHLNEELKKGAQCEVEISFKGVLWETAEGLFRGSYVEKSGEKK